MARKNWDEIARQEFKAMPLSYQADWQDLRKQDMGRHL